jgi:hypothetical protein
LTLAQSLSAFATLQKHTGKGVAAVTVLTQSEISLISSTSLQSLPGASVTITVPAGQIQLVEADFSADSTCQGSFAENFCVIEILADGAEMSPVSAGDFAFDGVGTADDFYEAHGMQRSILLGSGKHTIKVQGLVTLSGMSFFLDDWSLTITQFNGGK